MSIARSHFNVSIKTRIPEKLFRTQFRKNTHLFLHGSVQKPPVSTKKYRTPDLKIVATLRACQNKRRRRFALRFRFFWNTRFTHCLGRNTKNDPHQPALGAFCGWWTQELSGALWIRDGWRHGTPGGELA